MNSSIRWRNSVVILISFLVITNGIIYFKLFRDRMGAPRFEVILSGNEIDFPFLDHRSEITFNSESLRLNVNSEAWLEDHASLKAHQVLGYCLENSTKERKLPEKAIFALVEFGGLAYEKLKSRRKDVWNKCLNDAKNDKKENARSADCEWQERSFKHLSRLVVKDVFFSEDQLKPFESERNRYLILRGTLHGYYCPTDSKDDPEHMNSNLYLSLDSKFSVPDEFRREFKKISAGTLKDSVLEAKVAVGHEYLLRLRELKLAP